MLDKFCNVSVQVSGWIIPECISFIKKLVHAYMDVPPKWSDISIQIQFEFWTSSLYMQVDLEPLQQHGLCGISHVDDWLLCWQSQQQVMRQTEYYSGDRDICVHPEVLVQYFLLQGMPLGVLPEKWKYYWRMPPSKTSGWGGWCVENNSEVSERKKCLQNESCTG